MVEVAEFVLLVLGPHPFHQFGAQDVKPAFAALLAVSCNHNFRDLAPVIALLLHQLAQQLVFFDSPVARLWNLK